METSDKFRIVAAVCALVVGLSAPAPAKVVYVDDDAAGANTGSSWAEAFVYLQDALALAQPGDEVRVAQGLYRPDQNARVAVRHGTAVEIRPSGLRTAAFRLHNGLEIKGGFAGVGAADPNVRDVGRYESILSGDLAGDDAASWEPGQSLYESLRVDNSAHVVESHGTDATAVLDGFTIQAAVESGLDNWQGSPCVANCTFRWNSGGRLSGGALSCVGGRPTLSNCVFRENFATFAGGAIAASVAQLTLSKCRFVANHALDRGGAICGAQSVVSLSNCTLEQNTAAWGGAVYQQQNDLTLMDCRFEANVAEREGGAVYLYQGTTPSVIGCTFRTNVAVGAGGALASDAVHLTLDTCTFSGNRAEHGGALYAFQPWANSPANAAEITHCLFTGNHVRDSGASVYTCRTLLAVVGCTFADNQARQGNTLTRLLEQERPDGIAEITMSDCILWDGPRSVITVQGRAEEIIESKGISIAYSDVQGGESGAGNIGADPYFAAPGHWADASDPAVNVEADAPNATWIGGDYHLKSQAGRWDPVTWTWVQDEVTSPCIDAGDPASPLSDEPLPNGGRINLGVYGGTAEASKSYY